MLLVKSIANARVMTNSAWKIIQMINGLLPRRARSSFRSCAGEGIAPNIPINTAPDVTRIVPDSDHFVKGSLRMSDAHIELKTRPAACRVERTGSGSVEI
jgi:hypothetical protein